MNLSIKRCVSLVAAAFVFLLLSGTRESSGKIVLQGTADEMKQLQQAIDDMKAASPTGKKLYDALVALPQSVTIKFGDVPDIGGASDDGKSIVLNKAALSAVKQIDAPGGGGKALEESSLKYVLGHEALGHILPNLLKSRAGHGEDVAVRTENILHSESGSATRTKYYERVGNKDTIPFSDGSRLDITDAEKSSHTSGGKQPYARAQEDAKLSLSATVNADGSVSLRLDPGAGSQHITLDTHEFGGGILSVPLLGFSATLQNSLADQPDNLFNLVVTDFSMKFDSFALGSSGVTGVNTIDMIEPSRTPIGSWDFSAGAPFSFQFSGDFLWHNALFDSVNDFGYVLDSFTGSLSPTGAGLLGDAVVEGAKYGVPEPHSSVLACSGLLALAAARAWGLRLGSARGG
jgi:hypothetical protein